MARIIYLQVFQIRLDITRAMKIKFPMFLGWGSMNIAESASLF